MERSRVLLLTSLISFFSKGVSFIVVLVSLPLTINYLGYEKFGLLNTLISTFSVLTFSDLGMGMGLQNTLPQYIANNQKTEIHKTISTTFYFLVIITVFFFSCTYIFVELVDVRQFFNIKRDIPLSVVKNTILMYALVICVGIPGTIIQRIQNAYQKGYIAEIWITIGNIAGLGCLFVVTHQHLDLPWIVFSMQGVMFLSFIANFLNAIFIRKKYEIPLPSFIDKEILKSNIRFGFNYLLLSICALLVNSIDSFLIAKNVGMQAVSEYSVGFRFITFLSTPVLIFCGPLTTAYNDAWVRGDKIWLRKIILRYVKGITLGTLVSVFVIVLLGNQIIELWIGKIKFTTYQLLMFAVFLSYINFNLLVSMIALSARFVKTTIKIYPLAVIVSLIGKIMILYVQSQYLNMIWSTIICMALLFFLPIILKVYREDFTL